MLFSCSFSAVIVIYVCIFFLLWRASAWFGTDIDSKMPMHEPRCISFYVLGCVDLSRDIVEGN